MMEPFFGAPSQMWGATASPGFGWTTSSIPTGSRNTGATSPAGVPLSGPIAIPGTFPTFLTSEPAVGPTAAAVVAVVAMRGELKPLLLDLERPPLLWAIAGGIALTIAVSSLFHALSLGPSNVVPIYGMFIVGGSLLGVLFLEEPMSWNKVAGLVFAVIGVVLISL